MPRLRSASQIVVSLVSSASLVSAYSFVFSSNPQQCANLSLQITGAGEPPYNVLLIPYGPTPLADNVEVRTIVSQQFTGDASSVSLQLKYPANSQFVAVVSDSSGFGTGGTSVAATVTNSSDSSCFNASQSVSPDFPYNINPANQVVQCNASRLWWDPSQVQGNLNFQGVIPGGESFSIPVGTLTNVTDMGTGFSWTPTVRAGSTLLVIAGDDRGLGTGGSSLYDVSAGLYPNSSCVTNASPSSTAGSPAGGTYPTSISGTTTGGSSHSSTDVGAIVGGVIGGLAAIVILGLIAFYAIRRKTASNLRSKERPVDLLHGDPEDNEPPSNYQLPPYMMQPEPYLVTSPTISSSFSQSQSPPQSTRGTGTRHSMAGSAVLSDALLTDSPHYGMTSLRPLSGMTSFSDQRSVTPELELGLGLGLVGLGMRSSGSPTPTSGPSSSRKSAPMRQLRPVNIIQHEDAGPSGGAPEEGETETIELPPAYTNIRKDPSPERSSAEHGR